MPMHDQDEAPKKTGEGPATPPVTSFVTAPPPPVLADEATPEEIESYVRASMHQDRSPGKILVVCHPLRMYKIPRGLFDALRNAGFELEIVETHPDRVESVTKIRDGLQKVSEDEKPVDILAISGDGSLDHHVLVAAFWAFYPDLVEYRDGEIALHELTEEERRQLPSGYRQAFLEGIDTSRLEPDEDTIKKIWLLRAHLERAVRKGRSVRRIFSRAGVISIDQVLRVSVLAALLPHRVTLRPHGFDLAGLATATQESTFQGLYPFIRSITAYPAGTAADNALYAGVPGWGYAQMSRIVTAFPSLDGFRTWLEGRLVDRFMDFFLRDSVIVPARFSIVAFDGHWQLISSHAAGGPGAGHFFSADLTSKTKGLMGYLARIPKVVISEGLFNSTVVRIRALAADGSTKLVTEGQMVEGLYTNRTFIAGVGSVPSTNPTSFAGQSSLVVAPPIWYRNSTGRLEIYFGGLLTFTEGILKGVLGRTLHLLGFNVGKLAGGGKFAYAKPEHQITVKEGEEIDIDYMTLDYKPRFVPNQVSGDPFQSHQMCIRVAWGPIPLLAKGDALLLAAARRSLAQLRVQQSYRLGGVYIGGLYYFHHQTGQPWTTELSLRTGLFRPPHHLHRRLDKAQQGLLDLWQELETGKFVDTSEYGMQLGR
ncbi:MAG: hypothetical protein HN348_18640, partial [Proteobacteria bacterium]|nr:hypothetical protein [Pseudomonadota bacterium]